MTTALATLLICIAGAALVIAIGTYFWVNRTPSTNERFDRYGRVPLFGVSLSTNTPGGSPVVAEMRPAEFDPEDDTGDADNDFARKLQRKSGDGLSGPISSNVMRHTPAPTNPVPTVPAPYSVPPVASASALENGNSAGSEKPRVAPRSFAPPEPASAPLPFSRIPTAFNAPRGDGSGNGTNVQDVPGAMVEGHGLRFSVPAEGTLQFLPGRLEVIAGLDAGREIRFVRVPGPNGTDVTFGRNEGPLYQHIQLRDQTVSREHARMSLFEGQWSLVNLSRTNPIALNGRILGLGEEQQLHEGDRIEMGEVVFSYRGR